MQRTHGVPCVNQAYGDRVLMADSASEVKRTGICLASTHIAASLGKHCWRPRYQSLFVRASTGYSASRKAGKRRQWGPVGQPLDEASETTVMRLGTVR